MVAATDGGLLPPCHQFARLHVIHDRGRPVENYSDIGNQILYAVEESFPYSFAVAAAPGTDGAAFVKKGVISSASAT